MYMMSRIIAFILALTMGATPAGGVGASIGVAAMEHADDFAVIGRGFYKTTYAVLEEKYLREALAEMADKEYSVAELAELLGIDQTYVKALYAMYAISQGYSPKSRSLDEIAKYVVASAKNPVLAPYISADVTSQLQGLSDLELGFLALMSFSSDDAAAYAGIDAYMAKLVFTMMDQEEKPIAVALRDIAAYVLDQKDALKKNYGISIPDEELLQKLVDA